MTFSMTLHIDCTYKSEIYHSWKARTMWCVCVRRRLKGYINSFALICIFTKDAFQKRKFVSPSHCGDFILRRGGIPPSHLGLIQPMEVPSPAYAESWKSLSPSDNSYPLERSGSFAYYWSSQFGWAGGGSCAPAKSCCSLFWSDLWGSSATWRVSSR